MKPPIKNPWQSGLENFCNLNFFSRFGLHNIDLHHLLSGATPLGVARMTQHGQAKLRMSHNFHPAFNQGEINAPLKRNRI